MEHKGRAESWVAPDLINSKAMHALFTILCSFPEDSKFTLNALLAQHLPPFSQSLTDRSITATDSGIAQDVLSWKHYLSCWSTSAPCTVGQHKAGTLRMPDNQGTAGWEQWLSMCGPQTDSISTPWELIRSAYPWAPDQFYWIRNPGGRSSHLRFNKPSQAILMLAKIWELPAQ